MRLGAAGYDREVLHGNESRDLLYNLIMKRSVQYENGTGKSS